MLRSLWLFGVYATFLVLGVAAPFVTTLGYVWVDIFQPQNVAYILLNQFPVAFVMGAAAFLTYFMMDRRSPPPITAETVLLVLLTIYMTASFLWAVRPDVAMIKWDWAVKTLIFSVFTPFVIRSRVQIEAFATVYVFALAANFVPFGLKVIISGGGYGVNLGLQAGNSSLAEGGLLSTFCLMAVPITIFLGRHGQLIPRLPLMPLAYWCVAGLALVTAVGTYQRSALIGLVFMLVVMAGQVKNKAVFAIVALGVLAGLVYFTSQQWVARISTIEDYQSEGSAYTRILVWRWTLGFVATHPFGGGLMSHVMSVISLPAVDGGSPAIVFGRAFHSIYFEMLGECGYPGLAMFLSIIGLVLYRLHSVARRARLHPELEWARTLARALQASLAAFLTAGAFVSIAYQPMLWHVVAMTVSLNAYMYRVERGMATQLTGWRAIASAPKAGGWRNRPAPPNVGPASRLR